MERWKDVRGYRGRYRVSTKGAVWSVLRSVRYADGRTRPCGGQYVSHNVDPDGYHYVSLYKHGKRKQVRVHVLVARHFVPNPDGKPEVNHRNLNKDDNAADNLEWMTHAENMRHMMAHYAGTPADYEELPL